MAAATTSKTTSNTPSLPASAFAARSALSWLWPVAGFILAYVLYRYVAPQMKEFHAKLLMDIGINIILAVSLTLVNGFTGQFSIGHAGFMAVGGYGAVCLTYYGSYHLWGSGGVHGEFLGAGNWLFVAGCLLGGVLAAVAGYIVGLPSLRLRGDYLAIVTLGFGEIVRILFQQTDEVLYSKRAIEEASFGETITSLGGALGFTGIPKYTNIFWVYAFVTIMLLVAFRLKYSTYGRAFLSIREDEIAAEAMGVPIARYKVRAFVLAAFFAGIAGALFAHETGTQLNPKELGFNKSFDIIIMVVLGGMGSISGAVLAAAILTILPEALRDLAGYRMIFYALCLILMMILRPQGLFGIHELWEFGWFRRITGRGARRSFDKAPKPDAGAGGAA